MAPLKNSHAPRMDCISMGVDAFTYLGISLAFRRLNLWILHFACPTEVISIYFLQIIYLFDIYI